MRGPFFNELVPAIRSRMMAGENLPDIERMYEHIIRGRRLRAAPRLVDEQIALAALCFWDFPGKPPSAREQATQMRLAFVGIDQDLDLRLWFVRRIPQSMLRIQRVSQLSAEILQEFHRLD